MTTVVTVTRADRVKARRAPIWRWRDTLTLVVVVAVLMAGFLRPAWLADLGDTVVGPVGIAVPQQGVPDVSWSQLILNFERFLVIGTGCFVLFAVRSIPVIVRLFLVGTVIGLAMNYARNVYSGNPATVSFVLVNAALLLNNFRLMVRPSVWEQMVAWRNRAERAEQETEEIRKECASNLQAAQMWQARALRAEAAQALAGGAP